MIILAIETSCDETAISIIEQDSQNEGKIVVLSNVVVSQIELHRPYGGVFPMLAKREHALNLLPVLETALREAELYTLSSFEIPKATISHLKNIFERDAELLESFLKFIPSIAIPKIDIIAYTRGPGLPPALWEGVNFATALSLVWSVSVIPVNHMEGHLLSPLLHLTSDKRGLITAPHFPTLALLISGGHTEIILNTALFSYELVGTTRDDAVGEAFDKAARIMGLPYPGGPEISKLANNFRTSGKVASGKYKLPRPMLHSDDYDFSFSGIKTAVLYMVQKIETMTDDIREEICFEFEEAVTETLLTKVMKAATAHNPAMILLGGGVACNTHIQKAFQESFAREFPDALVCVPERALSTDNALMIAFAGYERYLHDKKSIIPFDSENLLTQRADGNWSLA